MGESRMRISFSKVLLQDLRHRSDVDSHDMLVLKKVFAADATVADVVEDMVLPPLSLPSFPENLSLWDCTRHPPKEISDWPRKLFPEKNGPKSKTLFSAGCFPSGSWQVLKKGEEPKVVSMQHLEENEYNRPISNETISVQQLSSSSLLAPSKPSSILRGVETRFDHEGEQDTEAAMAHRRQLHHERIQKEKRRNEMLESRIQALASSKKKSSAQVRKMLIKSRCKGNSSLKVQDRIYLHVAFVVDNDDVELKEAESFRYFSRQDTVRKIQSTFASNFHFSLNTEILVRQGESGFAQLPLAIRLYEAVDKHLLNDVDSLIMRGYVGDDATAHVQTGLVEQWTAVDANQDDESFSGPTSNGIDEGIASDDFVVATDSIHRLIEEAVQRYEASDKKRKAKSSTSEKVRTMLMKSKAKGDKKRVPKLDDRFFMQLLVVDHGVYSTMDVFMSKRDTISRVVSEHLPDQKLESIRVFAATKPSIVELDQSTTFTDAEKRGAIQNFQRYVVVVVD